MKRTTNRGMQIEASTALCKEFIHDAEHLYSMMWNKTTPILRRKQASFAVQEAALSVDRPTSNPTFIRDKDEKNWVTYEETFDGWKSKHFTFESELQSFFSFAGLEVQIFKELVVRFDSIAEKCDTLGNKEVRSNMSSKAGDEKRHDEFTIMYDEFKSLLIGLSVTMINCIQKGYVGNLREMNAEPKPSKEMMMIPEHGMKIVGSPTSMMSEMSSYSDSSTV